MCSLFCELIRVALGTQKNPSEVLRDSLSRLPSEAEWEVLFDMAVKQSLVGICFVGLHNLGADSDEGFAKIGMSEDLFFNWMGMAAQISMRNEVVNQQCVELQNRFSDDGFRSCILKGQGVAALYREELRYFRQSGDIDIWVDASKETLVGYVMRQAPTNKFDQKHIHFHCYEDTEVEAHWAPVFWFASPKNKILQAYFEQERERQFTNRINGLCVPTSDFQVVHQMLHVYAHYVYEGVGMRQMMDLYFAQLACAGCPEGSLERRKYREMLGLFRRFGLLRFVAATQWVLHEVFGMSEGVLLCSPDEKEGRKLLNEIMIGGNFGHHDERNHVAGESFIHRFLRRWGRKFRMFRFNPLGTLIMPLTRLKLEFWMRSIRRKYNV